MIWAAFLIFVGMCLAWFVMTEPPFWAYQILDTAVELFEQLVKKLRKPNGR